MPLFYPPDFPDGFTEEYDDGTISFNYILTVNPDGMGDPSVVVYSSYTHRQYNIDGSQYDPQGEDGGACYGLTIQDIQLSTSTECYAVDFGDQVIVQTGGLSTDPIQNMLLAGGLMLLSAMYVRRVFFS